MDSEKKYIVKWFMSGVNLSFDTREEVAAHANRKLKGEESISYRDDGSGVIAAGGGKVADILYV